MTRKIIDVSEKCLLKKRPSKRDKTLSNCYGVNILCHEYKLPQLSSMSENYEISKYYPCCCTRYIYPLCQVYAGLLSTFRYFTFCFRFIYNLTCKGAITRPNLYIKLKREAAFHKLLVNI